jgi:hypothetical protein
MNNFYLYAVRLMALALLAIAAVMGVSPHAHAANSESIEISFDLAPVTPTPAPSAQPPKPTPDAQAEAPQVKPLQIPTQATRIPVGVADGSKATAELPPPPPEAYVSDISDVSEPLEPAVQPAQPAVQPTVQAAVQPAATRPERAEPEPIQFEAATPTASAAAPAPKPAQTSVVQAPVYQSKPSETAEPTALSFDLNPTSKPKPTQPQTSPVGQGGQATPQPTAHTPGATNSASLDVLFQNDSYSIVATAVGSAEGTRTPDGGRTWAFQGHVDPGNGVWNLGTFSYQHGASSPDEADRKQLERLKGQAQTLRRAAQERGITLTLEEELNGIDLANQSPRAALSRGGYMDRLKEAHDIGLRGSDAVLWARTRSFLDPDTNRWNAPGLGNTTRGVTNDQDRRIRAIARAIEAHQKAQQVAAIPSVPIEQATVPPPTAAPEVQPEQVASQPPAVKQDEEAIANDIISLDLAPM